MECRWWDSNPHGFPSDFESLASAIPPHRLIWIWMRFARFFGSWRDVQEGCWNLSTANWSKTFAASLKFQMGARSREADFESLASAIPPHRRTSLLYRIRPAKSSADFSRGIRKNTLRFLRGACSKNDAFCGA